MLENALGPIKTNVGARGECSKGCINGTKPNISKDCKLTWTIKWIWFGGMNDKCHNLP